jgi:hypothetical protein
MKTKLFWLTTITLLAALLLSGTVFAEGEVPGAPPAEVPPVLPADPATVAVEAPAVVVDAAPAAEVPVIEEALPDAAPAAEPVAVEAAIPVVSEEPQVALVDAQGEPMDMASQASAEVFTAADPYYKVGPVFYRFLVSCTAFPNSATSICQESSTPIAAAIAYINSSGKIPTDGKIYVEEHPYSDNISIDGSNPNLANLKGLIGIADTDGIFPSITGYVQVSNLHSGFTLSGFTINGGVLFSGNAGALVLQDLDVDGYDIAVNNHSGNITVKNVKSHHTENTGTSLNNTAAGNVVVSDSFFNDNDLDGLYIKTNGTISLNNVIASGNYDFGINLSGTKSITLKNVIANDNKNQDGISIETSSGSLTMENVTASGNNTNGIDAYNIDSLVTVTVKNLVANGNNNSGLLLKTLGSVTITNSQTNGNNFNQGLYIESSGRVTLNSIRSSNNGLSGLYIKGIETEASGVGIIAVASPTVTITSPKNAAQSNVFDGNGDFGIYISTVKPVNISNFSASGNLSANGVLVDGFWYYQLNPDGVTFTYTEKSAGATTILATIPNYTNRVNDNHGSVGLGVYSSGTVRLERTWVNGNESHGIEIITLGAITLKDVKANDNMGGCSLINSDSVKPTAITLTNVEFSRNNTDVSYAGAGLEIESMGNVTITNLTASDNRSMGAGVDNTFGVGKITLTKITLNNNGAKGLWADSNGIISLKDVTANGNGDISVHTRNDNLGFKAGIVLTNVRADGNNGTGIAADTNGTLVAKDINASNNAVTSGTIEGSITVEDFFNHSKGPDKWWFQASGSVPYTLRMMANDEYYSNPSSFDPFMALYDESGDPVSGTITSSTDDYYQIVFTPGSNGLYYLLASSPTDDGFYRLSINDSDPGSSTYPYRTEGFSYYAGGNVTISGTNTFSGNSLEGLRGWNAGNVSASNITASDNGTVGIRSNNSGGNVTLSGANVTLNNGWEGLWVDTNGTVKVTNFDGSGNGQDGISIVANTAGKAVTLTHVTVLNNTLRGLNIKADGNITLSNIRANDNGERGIYLENCEYDGFGNCAGTGNITMSGFNEASNNHLNGLDVLTNGTVTISNLVANSNYNSGISVAAFGINKKVTLNFISAMSNEGDGLYIESTKGLTTLNAVRAWLNTQDGANIISEGYPIVVKFSSFIANDRSGLGYEKYTAPAYPLFTFTNLSNIFLGNGLNDLLPMT